MNKKLIVIICIWFTAGVLFLLYKENLLGKALPWLLIAVCPVAHLLLMQGKHNQKNDKNKKCH